MPIEIGMGPIREKCKWRSHKHESTDAGHRGGAFRMSDEASVMDVERRECIVQLERANNRKREV